MRACSTVVSAPPPALGAAEIQRLGAARKIMLVQNLDGKHESRLLKKSFCELVGV
jgi:hypothetical protein